MNDQREKDKSTTPMQLLINGGAFAETAATVQVRFPRVGVITLVIAAVVGYVWAR
jgi:hypothetical protein